MNVVQFNDRTESNKSVLLSILEDLKIGLENNTINNFAVVTVGADGIGVQYSTVDMNDLELIGLFASAQLAVQQYDD